MLTSTVMARKVVVKMATLAPQGTDVHAMLLELSQEWNKITKGKKKQEKKVKQEQMKILGKDKSRPKLSFSLNKN